MVEDEDMRELCVVITSYSRSSGAWQLLCLILLVELLCCRDDDWFWSGHTFWYEN